MEWPSSRAPIESGNEGPVPRVHFIIKLHAVGEVVVVVPEREVERVEGEDEVDRRVGCGGVQWGRVPE